jgi:hypothetical protein
MSGAHRPDCDCYGCKRVAANKALREEIAWLKSFHWDDDRIADRLGINVKSMQTALRRHRGEQEAT